MSEPNETPRSAEQVYDTHGETKAMGLVVAFYLLLLARLREVA